MRKSERITAGKPPPRLIQSMSTTPSASDNIGKTGAATGGAKQTPSASDRRLPMADNGDGRTPSGSASASVLADIRKESAAQIEAIRAEFSGEMAAQAVTIGQQMAEQMAAQMVELRQMLATQPPQPHNVLATSATSAAISASASSAASSTATPSEQNLATFRAKLYDLPEFDGKPEDWLIFEAEYEQTTAEYRYTDAQNVSRLRRSLQGPARELVSCLLVRPDNVRQAMNILARQYGKPQCLVASQLKRVRQIPPIDDDHMDQFVPLAAKVANMVAYLDAPKTQQHLFNPMIIEEILLKLPQRERREWGRIAKDIQPYPSLKDVSTWLDTVAEEVGETMVQFGEPSTDGVSKRTNPFTKPQSKGPKGQHFAMLAEGIPETTAQPCGICNKSGHPPAECYYLINLSGGARWDKIKEKGLCSACLSQHHWRDCDHQGTCGIEGCHKRHHPVLHTASNRGGQRYSRTSNGNVNTIATNTQRPSNTVATMSNLQLNDIATTTDPPATSNDTHQPIYNIGAGEASMLFRIVPVLLTGPLKTIRTHAMLDEGSSVTLLDEQLSEQLGLDGQSEQLNVKWFGNQSASERSRRVNMRISGVRQGDISYALDNVHTVKNLQLPTQTMRIADFRASNINMRQLPIADLVAAQPKMLIGLEHCHLGVAKRTMIANEGGAVAAKTKLGWMLYGPRPHVLATKDDSLLYMHSGDVLSEIQQLVREYFTTENFGVYQPQHILLSEEEKYARLLLEKTTTRIGNRYETGLLWKKNHPPLPPSRHMALQRLFRVEAKMRKNSEYAEQYCRLVNDFLAKGYARKMEEQEAATTSMHTWYLPHFAVSNINKPGKLRLVFDAAAAVHGISLNSVLSKGPDLYKSLPDVLFAFRIGRIAVTGDIREMFCQIRIRAEDQDAQRFLWRGGDSTKPAETYVMTSMTFGATCSPCSAHYVRNRNAEEHRPRNEEALHSITDHHYVDDFVASFPSAEKAIEVTSAVKAIHCEGGFELRGLVCNDRLVQEAVGESEETANAVSRSMEMELDATEKILGLFWQACEDIFVFRCKFYRVAPDLLSCERRPTKREMLSITMSVFDPFGMIANFMLSAKLLVQETWTIGVEWDAPIPDIIYQRWLAWQKELPRIATCRLPRCYSQWLATSKDVQLHIFADASELAFAAVAYWRIGRPDGRWDVSFVAGKTRCAPKKQLSVPRLELQAAVLAVRLGIAIRSAHNINNVRTVYWSDSRTVVCWIRSHHRRYKPFVAHRIAEILEDSAVADWRWIPTAANVADDATRPVWPPKFDPNSRWLFGSPFLLEHSDEWPTEPDATIDAELPEQVGQTCLNVAVADEIIPYHRFSRYVRLRRAIAWLLRFVSNTRNAKADRIFGELAQHEIADAETLLCKQAQFKHYADEIGRLKRSEMVLQSSSIYRLRPYLDQLGVMRLRGRLDAAVQLSAETRRPIILPKYHALTELIVDDAHCRMKHQNDEAVVCALRERFWVTHARVAVRSARKNCQRCKVSEAIPVAPMMGALPADRVTVTQRPFTYTGLDYFGPVFVTVGRRREKRWVALFTCLSVRAVHLELAADLSTDACILCIRNFINLRGVPARIRSDNGTNFVGANRELRNCVDELDNEELQRECSGRRIEWLFNCPHNPEAGGCWERLVRSVKRVLAVTVVEVAPRVETLRSLLIEAANIVNSRPLTHLPVECDEEDPLTPNHFLLGAANLTQTPGPIDPKVYCSRKQWRIAQELKNRFWKRWMIEYLPELTRRTKWFMPIEPLSVGDLVLVCDRNIPRSQWPKGRIIEVCRGKDGQVRTATLRTASGEVRRPANKLAKLDVAARDIEGKNPAGIVTGGAVAEPPC